MVRLLTTALAALSGSAPVALALRIQPYHGSLINSRGGAAAPAAAAAVNSSTCASLATTFASANTTILSSSIIPAGANITVAPGQEVCGATDYVATVDTCRFLANLTTSNQSFTTAEVFLPAGDDVVWNGRFVMTGNGALGGCIAYDDMVYTNSMGFAAAGSNGGHDGRTAEAFLNNNEVVLDWVWRG